MYAESPSARLLPSPLAPFCSKSSCTPLLQSPAARLTSLLAALPAQTTADSSALVCNVDAARLPTLVLLRGVDYPLLDIRRERVERFLHVDVALGRDLEEGDAEFVGQRLALLGADGALLLPVAFVADEDLVDAFAGVLLDIGEPGADVCYSVRRPRSAMLSTTQAVEQVGKGGDRAPHC